MSRNSALQPMESGPHSQKNPRGFKGIRGDLDQKPLIKKIRKKYGRTGQLFLIAKRYYLLSIHLLNSLVPNISKTREYNDFCTLQTIYSSFIFT